MKGKHSRVHIPGLSATDEGDPDGAFILIIEGEESSGKSALALDGPGPFAYYGIDAGAKRAVRRARNAGKEVHATYVPFDVPRFVPKQEKDFWLARAKKVKEDIYLPYAEAWEAGIDSSHIRTMIQDTATDIYELHQTAEFGKLQQNSQLAYGPIKAEYMGMVKRARRAGKLVILIHQLGPEYKKTLDQNGNEKSEKTGRLLRLGMNKAHYLADAIVRTHRIHPVLDKKTREETKPGRWETEIILAKNNTEANGMILEDPSFLDLMALLDPDTDPAFWVE